MDVKATDRCGNCHHEFADHEYVKDSWSVYRCPIPFVDSGYGFFSGGDPRRFSPAVESCSPAEIDNHKRACALWNEAESRGETPEPEKCLSGLIYDEQGKAVAHVLRAPYGIGCYSVEWEQFWTPEEHDYESDADE
jgi:hypothetical protein